MFADTKRLVIVTAHPDDLETICGGTVVMLARRGVEICQVLCTSGNIGTHDVETYTRESLAATRQTETREAAAVLGIKECFFLGRNDGELVPDLELRAELAWLYRRLQPDTLWTFDPWWPGQAHPDHQAAGRAALDAYMPAKMPLYHPEQLVEGIEPCQVLDKVYLLGGSTRDNFYVDVSDVWDVKIEATLKHRSQFGDGEEATKWLGEWAGQVGHKIGVKYAESFARMDVW